MEVISGALDTPAELDWTVVSTVDGGDPGKLADDMSVEALDARLLQAERSGDAAAAELFRQAVMAKHQRPLFELRRRIDRYLLELNRGPVWSTWRDDGLVAWRLRVPLGDAGLPVDTPGLTYWISDADDEILLMVDRLDDRMPSDFARRTARSYPPGELSLKRIEHLIIAQLTVGPRNQK